jgi:hypothetical protein
MRTKCRILLFWTVFWVATQSVACSSPTGNSERLMDASASDAVSDIVPTPDAEQDSPSVQDDVVPIPDSLSGDVSDDVDADISVCREFACPCENDTDCESNLCLPLGSGGESFCSALCTENTDCANLYECRVYTTEQGDLVSYCVPPTDWCTPCAVATSFEDCGGAEAACVAIDDGSFCLPRPLNDRCPAGFLEVPDAESGELVCVPEARVCSDCFDLDDDGYGQGLRCAGPDCDPDNADVYQGAVEICDLLDNNCDGRVDETIDIQSDPQNCGACGVSCTSPQANGQCIEGRCQIVDCQPGYGDCDQVADNGCETALPSSCGTCESAQAFGEPCGICGTGITACTEEGAAVCVGDVGAAALNRCGGCSELSNAPGEPCAECGEGTWTCSDDDERLDCVASGGEVLTNACGGCTDLTAEPGVPCGTCNTGQWECDGEETVTCADDAGEAARNVCRGCTVLANTTGDPCGSCGEGIFSCSGTELFCDTTDERCARFVRHRVTNTAWRGESTSGREFRVSGAFPVTWFARSGFRRFSPW